MHRGCMRASAKAWRGTIACDAGMLLAELLQQWQGEVEAQLRSMAQATRTLTRTYTHVNIHRCALHCQMNPRY